jgi:hypothetical protein
MALVVFITNYNDQSSPKKATCVLQEEVLAESTYESTPPVSAMVMIKI